MIASDILASLGKVGKLFYDTMLRRLNAGGYPRTNSERGYKSIQDATSVKSPLARGGTFSVNVVINTSEDGGAPFAGAYEWGSGEHGEQGTKYRIEPKNSDFLVFPEDDWPNFVPGKTKVAPNKNGLFFLTKVEHPGIQARPYIQPTIDEIKDDVKKILAQDFKAMVLREGRALEVIK